MTGAARAIFDPRRVLRGLARRFRGEVPAAYFNPHSRRDLTRLLEPFGIPVPAGDPRADLNDDANSAFDRVRQVYELRPDVRGVFPLGLTPAQRGEYVAWLFRHGRGEYGLTDGDILCYLFALADDPACGLGATYLLSPEWQRAVPEAFTAAGWETLKKWVARTYPEHAGRWLRGAARQPAFADYAREPSGPAINLLGHFKYDSGLQEEALQHVAALEQAGYRTYLRDVPVSYPRDWRDGSRFTAPERGAVTLIKTGANDPLDEIYARAGLHPRPGVYRVACWSWELEDFPRHAVERGGLANEVWTPSEFCARSVRAAMPGAPVFAVQPAVTLPPFPPRPRGDFGLPADHFVFLFMFDLASGMERKNPLGLIRAFRRAFRPGEAVHLAIKVSRGAAHPAEFAELCRDAAAAGATVIDRVMPRADVCALLANCDAYVSLHRSEGFGFTTAEAMLMGKPTIATGYSGNLDFMTTDNSFLVEYDRVPLARDHGPYPKGCVWADPSEAHAAGLMRRVFNGREGAAAVAARGRATVATFLSREAAARRMTARLAEIARR